MAKDPDCTEQINCAHGIQQMFMYEYKDKWMPEKVTLGRSRIWTQAFNNLRKSGFIERKKTKDGYQYKWKSKMPE